MSTERQEEQEKLTLLEELDELEWDNINGQPGIQRGLSRLAAEIRRQIAAGEFEEGGFAI